jgi:hypothetical protein
VLLRSSSYDARTHSHPDRRNIDNPERAKKRDAAVNSFEQSFDEIIIFDRAERIA